MAFSDIFRSKENTESLVPPMKIFDNITNIVRDDLQKNNKKEWPSLYSCGLFLYVCLSGIKATARPGG